MKSFIFKIQQQVMSFKKLKYERFWIFKYSQQTYHIHVHVLSNVVVLKNDFEKRRLVLIVYKWYMQVLNIWSGFYNVIFSLTKGCFILISASSGTYKTIFKTPGWQGEKIPQSTQIHHYVHLTAPHLWGGHGFPSNLLCMKNECNYKIWQSHKELISLDCCFRNLKPSEHPTNKSIEV